MFIADSYTPHWLDAALCRPGTHDNRIDRETDPARTDRLVAAFFTCARCPVDKGRCLENGVALEADGVHGGVLLEDGKPVNPQPRAKKAAA